MGIENFRASVQYDDWKGTVAADDHDNRGLNMYLEENGLINDGEFLIGFTMWSGAVHSATQEKDVTVRVLLTPTGNGKEKLDSIIKSDNPLKVREVEFHLALNKFFGLFKRFEIALSSRGLITDKEIDIEE